jgi:hypothetical protein
MRAIAAAAIADAANTTSRLGGTGTFESSSQGASEDGLAGGTAFDIVTDGRGECVFGVQLQGGDVAPGDVITFRLLVDGATFTYSQTPTLNVVTGPVQVVRTLIAAGGGDYTSLSAWESAEQRNLVTQDEIAILECQAGSITNALNLAGWTTDATHYTVIRAATGHEHGGIPGAGFKISNNTATTTIAYTTHNGRISGIEVANSSTGSAIATASGTGQEMWISGCLVGPSGANGISIGNANAWIYNNIVFDNATNQIQLNSAGVTAHVYNNTVKGGTHGIRQVNGTYRPKNNIAQGNSTACFNGTFTDSATNISSDATSPETGLRSIDLDFVDEANDDYHLASTDTEAVGAGTDLSADASLAFDWDIDGDARPDGAWDIGADQTIVVITSIDTDNDTVDTRTGVAIAGAWFGASETGSAKVEISNNATYGSGTVVEIDVTSWSATSITVTLRRESDSAALAGLFTLPLSPAYLWVTTSAGLRNATGFQFTLRAPGPTALADLNTTPTIQLSTTTLLRARVSNSGGVGSTSFRWAYSLNGGAWTPITTSSDVIRAVAASSFANDDDVPGVIGSVSLADNNAATEDGTTTLAANFPAGGNLEFVLAFQRLDSGPIQIRLEIGDGTAFTTYTNVPSIASLGGIVTLDTAAIVGAGSDVLANARPTLDSATVALSGADLAANTRPTLDTGAVTAAGADLLAAVRATLDTGAIAVAGSDLTILEARTVTLDAAAAVVAGNDLTPLATVTLDTAAAAVAGADVAANVQPTLDTGAITAAGSDLAANQAVTLDTDDIALVGADLEVLAAGSVVLDTAAIEVAGADLTILAPSTIELDTGAISVAGTDAQARASILLDTGAISVAGSDLAAQALAVTLDTAAASLTGDDLAILAASTLELDIAAVAASGADLAANQAITLDTGAITSAGDDLVVLRSQLLDTGAITVAGSDLAALHMRVPLDTAAIAVAGADISPLAAGTVQLDQAAVTVAGQDATVLSVVSLDTGAIVAAGADLQQHAVVALDTGSVAAEGADVAPVLAIALDDASVVVAGEDLALSYAALLDAADIALVANDLAIIEGELGEFGPRQDFNVGFAAPQVFGGTFGAGMNASLIFGAPQAFNVTFASNGQIVVFGPTQSFEIAA